MKPSADPALREWVEQLSILLEREGLPRMAGRIFGWLLVCAPPEQTMEDLAAAVQGSKASMSTMTRLLAQVGLVEKVRLPGARRDAFRIRLGQWQQLWRARMQLLEEAAVLTGRGLALLARPPAGAAGPAGGAPRPVQLHRPPPARAPRPAWTGDARRGPGCGRTPRGPRAIGEALAASPGPEPAAPERGPGSNACPSSRCRTSPRTTCSARRWSRAARGDARHPARRVPLHRRPVGQRQDHAAQPDRLRGHRHRRHGAGRRARTRGASPSGSSPTCGCTPSASSSRASTWCRCSSVFQNVEFPLLLQGKLAAQGARGAGDGAARARWGSAATGSHRPERALRRPAAAGGGGPRAGHPAGAGARRRAHRQPRLPDRRDHHRPDEGDEPARRHHLHLLDPRPQGDGARQRGDPHRRRPARSGARS